MSQTGLKGPSLATVYHFWYSERLADGSAKHPDSAHADGECRCKGGTRGEDEISSAGGTRITQGLSVLPPAAVIMLDVEPDPGGSQDYYWPSWPFIFKDESGLVKGSGVLSNENPAIPNFVSIQSPERPAAEGGVWQGSSGYRLIAPLDGQTYKGSLEVYAMFGDGSVRSGVLVIPAISAL